MISVVGIGPGSIDEMTIRAQKCIAKADVVLGYKTYVRLVEPLLEGKEVLQNGMRGEVERCRQTIAEARKGKRVVLISGGDPGVYAMAGLLLELLYKEEPEISVEVVPGVTSANAAAAALGAPIMHDHAYISLSDCLTDWTLIEKRLELAAQGDFVICLFNPKSKARPDYLQKAKEIMLAHKSPNTQVGIVTHAARDEQVVAICDLAHMDCEKVNMSSMVIIGNQNTYRLQDSLVTPRGYKL